MQVLTDMLEWYRSAAVRKVSGISEANARRSPVSSGTSHLIKETARHVGHIDIRREFLDGTAGE